MTSVANVTPDQFERLVDAIDRQKQARADDMPTEHEALLVIQRAYERLKELGRRDSVYCPKDGTIFDSIEVGSTGIHDCQYQGEWPKGSWWVFEAGDVWPSHPVLFRLKAAKASPPPQAPIQDQGQDRSSDRRGA